MQKAIITGILLSLPILLPFSTERAVIAGVPLYIPEMAIIVALVLFLVSEGRAGFSGLWSTFLFLPFLVRASIVLLFLGWFVSALVNGILVSAYGELKSWYVFPILYVFLLSVWFYKGNMRMNDVALSFVFSGLLFSFQTFLAIAFSDTAITYDGRLRGGFDSPNQLAFSLVLPLFFAGNLFFQKKNSLLLGMALFFLGGTIFLTHSYAAIIGVAAGAMGILLRRYVASELSKERTIAFYIILICFLVTVFFVEGGSEKWQSLVSGDRRSSVASREMIWRSAAKILSDHPIFGIGQGNFPEKYLEYQRFFPPYLEWSAPHPHNIFLTLWLDAGIGGFLGIALLFLVVLKEGFFLEGEQKNENEAFFLVCLGFGIFLLFSGMVDTPIYRNNLAFTFWFGMLGIFLFRKKN